MSTHPLWLALNRKIGNRQSKISRGRDRPCERPPRTDPYVRDYLIRLLPRVHLTAHRSLGYRYHPFLPLAVRATTSVTRFPGSASGTSALVVRSPWSTSFPLRTPRPTLPRWLCSPASLVLRGRPTPCKHACRHYGLSPSSTVPHCYPVWASVGPPDSRAWSFLTCLGSLTPRC